MSSCGRPSQSGRDGPFFCCERIGPCYKPPPADGAACRAGVAELVEALDLGSSDESCGGSSPSARTKRSLPKRLLNRISGEPVCSGFAKTPAQGLTPRVDHHVKASPLTRGARAK